MVCPRRHLREFFYESDETKNFMLFPSGRMLISHRSKLLNFLLSGEEPDIVVEKIHEHLRELAEKMRQFEVPVQKYTIFTVREPALNKGFFIGIIYSDLIFFN